MRKRVVFSLLVVLELMRELIGKSMLPGFTLDISENNIPAAVERVADLLEQSGGLYMPD